MLSLSKPAKTSLTAPKDLLAKAASFGGRIQNRLNQRHLIVAGSRAFWVLLMPQRFVCYFNPIGIRNSDALADFNLLYTICQDLGYRDIVVTHASVGGFTSLQASWERRSNPMLVIHTYKGIFKRHALDMIPQIIAAGNHGNGNGKDGVTSAGVARDVLKDIDAVRFDVTKQPDPLSVSPGVGLDGKQLWYDIRSLKHTLVAGPSGSGKTNVMHAMIQYLIHGNACQLILWDRKASVEFGRYEGGRVSVVASRDLQDSEGFLQAAFRVYTMLNERSALYKQVGAVNLDEYNARVLPEKALDPIVICLDEAAELPKKCQTALKDIVNRARAFGVSTVIGLQSVYADSIDSAITANFETRIAFRTQTNQQSRLILGKPGAENLSRRYHFLIRAGFDEIVEAKALYVPLPEVKTISVPAAVSSQPVDVAKKPVDANALAPQLGADERVPMQRGISSPLTSQSAAMVKYAVEYLGGYFHIQKIAEFMKVSDESVTVLADRWEKQGWLTKTLYNSTIRPPRRLGRRVKAILAQKAGITNYTE